MTNSTFREAATIHERFAQQVSRTPDAPALYADGKTYSYRELDDAARGIAAALLAAGVRADQAVGLLTDRSFRMIAAILGILRAGAAYMPIDPKAPAERVRYMLADSAAPILLAQRSSLHKAEGYVGRLLILEESGSGEAYPEEVTSSEDTAADSLCYLLYTSGTTGAPKGVMIEHRNVLNLMEGLRECVYARHGRDLRIALVAPYYFDASVQQIFAALLYGHALYIVPEHIRIDGAGLLAFYHEHRIDITDGTPAHLKMLTYALPASSRPLSVKELIIGGEELTWAAVHAFYRCLSDSAAPVITNIYGPTECCVDSLAYTIMPAEARMQEREGSVPIGKPLFGQAAYVLDAQGMPLADREAGELYIGGNGVGRGYLHLAELTEQSFVPDLLDRRAIMYKTGDLVRKREDGEIEYLGRIDHQVKVRGHRIELGEIRSRLLAHPAVRDAEIAAVQIGEHEKELCAYIVADSGLHSGLLASFLALSLPEYMLPAYYMLLDRMPLTPNGKVDRKALPEPALPVKERRDFAAPTTETEQRLLPIWQSVLHSDNAGIDDDFFEWGGHSLKANWLVSQVRQTFGVELSVLDVFQAPTVRQLSVRIETADVVAANPLLPAGVRESYPLSASQRWMYIVSVMNANKTTWNMPGAFLIEGPLDAERLGRAAERLVERHHIFRTQFEWSGNEPAQQVVERAAFSVPVTASGEAEVEERIREFVRPFDLGRAPLIRMELLQLSESRHMLLFDAHHLVFDGASIEPVMQELALLYDGVELGKPELHYQDFAVWQQAHLDEQRLRKLDLFWDEAFAGEVAALDLPADRPRPARLSGQGGTLHVDLNNELSRRVDELSVRTSSSTYMVLLAAFQVLMHKYTGKQDIVVGSLSAGRSLAELERMPGMFAQTLAIRSFPSGGKTFVSFLHEVKEQVLACYAHEDYPADRFETRVVSRKRAKRQPLFEVMFSYLNYENQDLALTGCTVKPYPIELHLSRFDLVVEAKRSESGISLKWNYSIDLFDKATAESIAGHYADLLGELLVHPETPIGQISWGRVSGDAPVPCAEGEDEITFFF